VKLDLPSGTVTFLFTDIEGSTRLERELRERYSEVLAEHRRLLREAFERYGGREVDTQGDSFFVVFPRARDAVAAAVAAQRALVEHTWPDGLQVRVRIGMHTGEASLDDGRYVGLAVHRGARISAAGHGGQILLSSSTCDVVEDDLPAGQRLVDLGENRLKDLPRPERVFQLLADGLPTEFPPLKTVDEQELAEAAQAVPTLPWWQRRRLLVALAGIAAVTAIAASVLVFTLGSDAGATEISANALGLIDADGEAIDAEIPVDAAPTSVARGEGAIWVTNANDGTVSRIDPVTRSVRDTITVGSSPSGIAVGAGAVWVANHLDGTVSRIDPETNTVVDTIAVGNGPTAVAFGEGSVWVTNSSDRTVSRIDSASGRVVRTIKTDAVGRGLAVGGGSVWVTDESSRSVVRLNPETNAVAETISVGNGPTGIAFGERAVWVANSLDGTVSRIDPAKAAVTTTLAVPGGPGAVAAGGGAVWVSAEFAQRLARIDPDPADPKVVGEVEIGNRPKGVVVSEDGVWVTVQASGRGHRGGRLIAISGPFDSIDPQIANITSSAYAGSLVYDGLTGFRRAGGNRIQACEVELSALGH
jgi:YVTN family beta-propeller protein